MVGEASSEPINGPQRVAVVIPCHGARKSIAATVRACRAIPAVDLIVVVDDGSDDDTAQVARAAGAVAVRHSVSRGRASAMETGVKVTAMRDRADWPSRLVLFLDPDLGDSAVEAAGLVDAVVNGSVDCAIGVPTDLSDVRPEATAVMAWKGIRRTTGWDSSYPLSTQRCLTRRAINAVMPFSAGWGVDVGITIDLLVNGYSVVEVPCAFRRVSKPDRGQEPYVRARYWDIWLAVQMRRMTGQRVAVQDRIPFSQQKVGTPYQIGIR